MLIVELLILSAIYAFIAGQLIGAPPRRKPMTLTRADEIVFRYRYYAKADGLQLKGAY